MNRILLTLLVVVSLAVAIEIASTPDPSDKQALLDKGIAEEKDTDFDDAIADFSRAIAIDPKWAPPYEHRAASYAAMFESTESQFIDLIDKAVADYDTVVRLGAATARTYLLRGMALSDKGNYTAAFADFDRALSIDPKFRPALRAREQTVEQRRKRARSISIYSDLLHYQPRNMKLLLTRSILLASVNRREEALQDLARVLAIDPNNTVAQARRAALIRATSPEPCTP